MTEEEEMTDYTEMSGAELVIACGNDAQKWADAFCALNPHIEVDNDVLMGWFANAIIASLDLSAGGVPGVVCGDAVADQYTARLRPGLRFVWRGRE